MNDETFIMLQQEGGFPRLVELIHGEVTQSNAELQVLLLELMYEMSRLEKLKWEDLSMLI